MINYMDRSAVSVAAPLLMRDLKLDAAQMGIIFSAFFAGYALLNFIGGYAADVLGPKRVFTVAMTLWSAFCGLTAAATGLISLLFVRMYSALARALSRRPPARWCATGFRAIR
jgi:ACS family hexuronate transporter-like MFS transporter